MPSIFSPGITDPADYVPVFEIRLPQLPDDFEWIIPRLLINNADVVRFLCSFKSGQTARKRYLSCYIDYNSQYGLEFDALDNPITYMEIYAVGVYSHTVHGHWGEPYRIKIKRSLVAHAAVQKTFNEIIQEFCVAARNSAAVECRDIPSKIHLVTDGDSDV